MTKPIDLKLAKFIAESKVKHRVYHGTMSDVKKFKTPAYFGGKDVANQFSDPEYLFGSSELNEGEHPNVIPVHLNLKNPKIFTKEEDYEKHVMDGGLDPQRWIKKGHDGVIYAPNGDIEHPDAYYVAFHPNQIKSAIGNKGTYSKKSGDITMDKGGSVDVTAVKKRKDDKIPQLETAAKALLAGVITRAEYDKTVKQFKPVTKYTSVPRPATDEEAISALHENKRQHWRGADDFPEGHPVGLRLDIPAYSDHGVWVNSIHDESGAKTPVKYGPVSSVRNAEFDPGPSKAQRVATGETNKSPFAKIKGEWQPMTDEEAVAHMKEHLNNPDYVQVGYDPRRRDYFYHRGDTRKPITHAEHVVQIGPLVLAKNPVYGKRKDFGLAEGGVVHMDKGGDTSKYKDPKTTKIEDWKWRKLKEVLTDVPLTEVPDYIQKGYGEFMNQQLSKAQAGQLTPRDLLKAFTITQSSIGRGGLSHASATKTGMRLPNTGEEVRPEGAFAEWLGSPMGQRYLNAAERGLIHHPALGDIQQKFAPFGKHNQLVDQMAYAAQMMPKLAQTMNQAVTGGKDEYRDWAEQMRGIAGAKSGFIGSMLGRGDLPTLDARQLNLHTLPAKVGVGSIMSRGKGTGAREAVDRLASRQQAMNLNVDPSMMPHYQHLTHHAVWDAMGKNKTTHDDLVRAMRGYAEGGAARMAKGGTSLKELQEYILQKRGEFGAKRVQRAADEIPGLEGMFTPEALKHTFERQNAGLMTMNPADFEKFAERMREDITKKESKRKTRAEEVLPFEDYLKHLAELEGGFDEVPFLDLGHRDPEYLPSIEGHEGRHRSRALAGKGAKKSLVQLIPAARMSLTMPKKNSEKLVQKLRQTLGEDRFVSPEGGSLLPSDQSAGMYKWLKEKNLLDTNRPQLPEVYKRGGKVTHAHHLDIEERPL